MTYKIPVSTKEGIRFIVTNSKSVHDSALKYEWRLQTNSVSDKTYKLIVSKATCKNGVQTSAIGFNKYIYDTPQFNVVEFEDNNIFNHESTNVHIVSRDTYSLNNEKSFKKCTSKFKGVSRHIYIYIYIYNGKVKWTSAMTVNKKHITLGIYTTMLDAVIVYNVERYSLLGNKALLNDIGISIEKQIELYNEIILVHGKPNIGSKSISHQGVTKVTSSKTSKFIGVYKRGDTGKYQASIVKDNIKYSCGSYIKEEDAARAYDAKVIELYGKYAKLNFPIDHI